VALSAPLTESQLPVPVYRVTGFGAGEAPRVGLYRSYSPVMDEGWTRWVFDTWKVPYVTLVDSVVRSGKLKERFDVIVLPDQSPREILEGLPAPRYPAPYAGGIGPDGAEALRHFVLEGGALVALNEASRFAVQALLLPVRNVLEAVPDEDFYAPGSIFRLELDATHPVTRGVPRETAAWFQGGPAFDVLDSTVVRVIGRWPADPGRAPGLTGDEPDFLQSPQVRAKRIRVKAEHLGQLAHRDRAPGEPQVPVKAKPGVVGQRLVDVERLGFRHDALDGPRTAAVCWVLAR